VKNLALGLDVPIAVLALAKILPVILRRRGKHSIELIRLVRLVVLTNNSSEERSITEMEVKCQALFVRETLQFVPQVMFH